MKNVSDEIYTVLREKELHTTLSLDFKVIFQDVKINLVFFLNESILIFLYKLIRNIWHKMLEE